MKRLAGIWFILVFFSLLTVTGYCQDSFSSTDQAPVSEGKELSQDSEETRNQSLYEEQLRLSGADQLQDAIPEEAEEFVRHFSLDSLEPDKLLSMSFHDFIAWCMELLAAEITVPFRLLCYFVGVLLLCAVLDAAQGGREEKSLSGCLSDRMRLISLYADFGSPDRMYV